MLFITSNISIADSEIEFSAVRSQGPGGQNVKQGVIGDSSAL